MIDGSCLKGATLDVEGCPVGGADHGARVAREPKPNGAHGQSEIGSPPEKNEDKYKYRSWNQKCRPCRASIIMYQNCSSGRQSMMSYKPFQYKISKTPMVKLKSLERNYGSKILAP